MELNKEDIIKGLQGLGLAKGDAVEVHSSLSRLGNVIGNAPAVVDAIMDTVGNNGSIVMSAYPLSLPVPLTAEEKARGIAWKVRVLDPDSDEKTGMGVIVDEFKKRPGIAFGQGIHRTCAWGKNAELLSQGYKHLLDIEGKTLLLGVDIDRCSSMHIAEELVPIPDKINNIFNVPEDILKDYPEDKWGVGCGDTCGGDPWGKVRDEADKKGLIIKGKIGLADCMFFKTKDLVDIFANLRKRDPYGLYGVESD